MEKKQVKLVLLPILTVLLLSITNCNRLDDSSQQFQNSPTFTNGGVISPTPTPTIPEYTSSFAVRPTPDPTHGKADGEVSTFVSNKEDPRGSLLAAPAPEVWLVFPALLQEAQTQDNSINGSGSTIIVELPPEAKKILSNHWRYIFTIKRDTNLAEIVNARNDTKQALQKTKIDAPDGRREIAWDETEELEEFITKSALNLIKEANKYKK